MDAANTELPQTSTTAEVVPVVNPTPIVTAAPGETTTTPTTERGGILGAISKLAKPFSGGSPEQPSAPVTESTPIPGQIPGLRPAGGPDWSSDAPSVVEPPPTVAPPIEAIATPAAPTLPENPWAKPEAAPIPVPAPTLPEDPFKAPVVPTPEVVPAPTLPDDPFAPKPTAQPISIETDSPAEMGPWTPEDGDTLEVLLQRAIDSGVFKMPKTGNTPDASQASPADLTTSTDLNTPGGTPPVTPFT